MACSKCGTAKKSTKLLFSNKTSDDVIITNSNGVMLVNGVDIIGTIDCTAVMADINTAISSHYTKYGKFPDINALGSYIKYYFEKQLSDILNTV